MKSFVSSSLGEGDTISTGNQVNVGILNTHLMLNPLRPFRGTTTQLCIGALICVNRRNGSQMQWTIQMSPQARDRVIAATAIVSECRRQDGIMFVEFILVLLDKVPSLDKVCGERMDKGSSGTHGDIYINPSAQ